MKSISDLISDVAVHSSLSTEIDFDHANALTDILEDCTDEQLFAEIAKRRVDQQHIEIADQIRERYLFESIIGKGSSGVVHLVSLKETGMRYACKVLEKKGINDVASINTEVEIMRKVKHENIVELHEVFESPLCLWLIMELTCSNGLRGIMQKLHYLSEEVACRLIMQLMEGVHYLHSEGIVHRDLKIDNILFNGDVETGTVKIADFGLSAQVTLGNMGYHPTDSSKRKTYTGIHDRWGTVTHCSPELLFNNAYGPQTDMWSLGCIMYEMLTGTTAFQLFSNDKKMKNANLYRKIKGAVYDKKKLHNISASGKLFLERLLEVDPYKRLTASEALLHPWLKCVVNKNHSCPIRPPSPIFSAISRVLVPAQERKIKVFRTSSQGSGSSQQENKKYFLEQKQQEVKLKLQRRHDLQYTDIIGIGSTNLLQARNVNDSIKMSHVHKCKSDGDNVRNLSTRFERILNFFRS